MMTSMRPPLEIMLYDADVPTDGIIVRSDLPGYTTFMMKRTDKMLLSVDESDLASWKLSKEEAWAEAMRTAVDHAKEVEYGSAENVPGMIIACGASNNSIGCALLCWDHFSEWQGKVGSIVAFADKHSAFVCKADSANALEEQALGVMGCLLSLAGSENVADLAGLSMLWRDAAGWERIEIEVEDEGIVFNGATRFLAAMGTS
jgi:hypothetical protein